MNKEPDAIILLDAGRTLAAALECKCEECLDLMLTVDIEFIKVSTRYAQLAKRNPGLMFKILVEEWDKDRILEELPMLYMKKEPSTGKEFSK
jgi:hypothetical protein